MVSRADISDNSTSAVSNDGISTGASAAFLEEVRSINPNPKQELAQLPNWNVIGGSIQNAVQTFENVIDTTSQQIKKLPAEVETVITKTRENNSNTESQTRPENLALPSVVQQSVEKLLPALEIVNPVKNAITNVSDGLGAFVRNSTTGSDPKVMEASFSPLGAALTLPMAVHPEVLPMVTQVGAAAINIGKAVTPIGIVGAALTGVTFKAMDLNERKTEAEIDALTAEVTAQRNDAFRLQGYSIETMKAVNNPIFHPNGVTEVPIPRQKTGIVDSATSIMKNGTEGILPTIMRAETGNTNPPEDEEEELTDQKTTLSDKEAQELEVLGELMYEPPNDDDVLTDDGHDYLPGEIFDKGRWF